ncbi:TPA: hypothetical protein R1X36_000849 [Campylobacter upsaliensis]|nr:hypothetical protein [Campylobacter upsaliensis]
MKKIIFSVLFLSYSPLKAADECSYQEDRAVPLTFKLLGVTGVIVANAPAPNLSTKCH